MEFKVHFSGPQELNIAEAGAGDLSQTISNASGRPLKLQAEAIPIEPAKGIEPWLEISHSDRFWEFAANGTHNIKVRVTVPENAVGGELKFQLRVCEQDTPHEAEVRGPVLRALVGEKKGEIIRKRFPWWIVAVAAGVLVVVVGLVIAFGSKTVKVPDLVGKPMEEAMKLLEAAGLKGVAGDKVPAPSGRQIAVGNVAVQDPEAAAEVDSESEVTLYPRAEAPKMPTVVGMKLNDALRHLKAYHWGPFQHRAGQKQPEGTVIEQNPKPGAEVTSETEVTLVIAGPPEKKVVADYIPRADLEKYGAKVRDHRVKAAPPPPQVRPPPVRR